jgi:hypothetical protein
MSQGQLKWFQADMSAQDYELKTFVEDHGIDTITYVGDTDRIESLLGKAGKSQQLCVYVVNSEFSFSDVAMQCMEQINKLDNNGVLYLSLNKFLAQPEPWSQSQENYDMTILNYMITHVPRVLLHYHSGFVDNGWRFNWSHPLTRFYFLNASTQ